MRVLPLLYLLKLAHSSIGDNLPEYQLCVHECERYMNCVNVFEREKRHDDYTSEVFQNNYVVNPLFARFWSCSADCNYKCQQLITNQRQSAGLPMVQFFGKWPFRRVFGMQEFVSVLLSIGNFVVNYHCLFKVLRQYNKNNKNGGNGYHRMYGEYLQFIVVSLFGWFFSTLFHMRDNGVTETLDYYGAFAVVLMNFDVIFVRYMRIYTSAPKLYVYKALLALGYVCHCLKLSRNWDYGYNANINLLFGFISICLWVLHSMEVRRRYRKDFITYNNSIQLLPFEVKVLNKLNLVGLSAPRLVPILPVLLNAWLMVGMSFEYFDMEPVLRLVDAHAIWHLFTMFPPMIWYDWNIWDIEMDKLGITKVA